MSMIIDTRPWIFYHTNMRRREVIKKVLQISDEAIGTVADLILFQFYYMGASVGQGKTSRGVYKAIYEADNYLQEFNYQTIKNQLSYLRRRGLIRILKQPEITEEGKKKLRNIFPVYNDKRTWDGSTYLITYDISEKDRFSRDKLRDFLQQTGAGLLQQSVWLTVYNPEVLIKDFVKQERIAGAIIVSCLGKGGYITERSSITI